MRHTVVKTYSYQPLLYFDPLTDKTRAIFRPVAPVRLAYRHKLGKVSIDCLVDSGADINLFPADWGESVGINIKKGAKTIINGIGAIGVEAFVHTITLYLGSDISFEVAACFSYSQEIPLLGRFGFFDQFKSIIFKEKDKIVELDYNV